MIDRVGWSGGQDRRWDGLAGAFIHCLALVWVDFLLFGTHELQRMTAGDGGTLDTCELIIFVV